MAHKRNLLGLLERTKRENKNPNQHFQVLVSLSGIFKAEYTRRYSIICRTFMDHNYSYARSELSWEIKWVNDLQVKGTLINTGQTLVFRVDKDLKLPVNISGGPLAYRYQFEEMYFHYGISNSHGSEHTIRGHSFPGEVSHKNINHCSWALEMCTLQMKLLNIENLYYFPYNFWAHITRTILEI